MAHAHGIVLIYMCACCVENDVLDDVHEHALSDEDEAALLLVVAVLVAQVSHNVYPSWLHPVAPVDPGTSGLQWILCKNKD